MLPVTVLSGSNAPAGASRRRTRGESSRDHPLTPQAVRDVPGRADGDRDRIHIESRPGRVPPVGTGIPQQDLTHGVSPSTVTGALHEGSAV
ncbi:hypothetical protein GCM10020367_72270 [Streptomyces sannanensis]|uniref:Uncharacterized protein n=1 Tax=Streptomyces sannanensis TaxID=285536 RepID=A0ABP6SNA1_9ACTN